MPTEESYMSSGHQQASPGRGLELGELPCLQMSTCHTATVEGEGLLTFAPHSHEQLDLSIAIV